MMLITKSRALVLPAIYNVRMCTGEPGSGAGRGGGSGGSIRDAGGAFGRMEASRENQYFYEKQKQQLQKMKEHLEKEIKFHEDAIRSHEDAIRRHKEKMDNISTKESS